MIPDTSKTETETACLKDIRCNVFEYSASQSKGRLCYDKNITALEDNDGYKVPLNEDSIACTVEHGKYILVLLN